MKLKKPKFWDYKKPNFLSYLLLPLTLPIRINNLINTIKKIIKVNFIKSHHNYKYKTICVGNIYLGGTGKTPLAIKLSEILNNLNYKTVFIKKFHKDTSDETHLLKKNGEVLIYKDRINSLSVKNNFYDVAIFDDGLQDSSLMYDLSFVCFNNKNFIGNGMLIPAGPLREKINSIKKYDAIFLNGNSDHTNETISKIIKYNKNIKIFESTYVLTNLDIFDKTKKYVAFAGIGMPMNFYNLLNENKLNIIKFLDYPDHYLYTKNDIKKIKDIAKNLDAEILTTEKDYSRIQLEYKDELDKDIKFVKMKLSIKNEKELINFIKEKL
ncbi:tetraacyldisaccharide 4'-kinase [Candidatus Pelagibacter sp.]|nr:tetraacyldisaccharide 4'-kinase [Candidatus Pelagibacter sp.]